MMDQANLKPQDEVVSHKYRHKKLPEDRWIRLLQVLPGNVNDPIFCQLVPAELDQASVHGNLVTREPTNDNFGILIFTMNRKKKTLEP